MLLIIRSCFLTFFIISSLSLSAQENKLFVSAEYIAPVIKSQSGFGLNVNYGISLKNRQLLTLGTGFSSFYSRIAFDANTQRTTSVPFLIGYLIHVGSFYVHPQLGPGLLSGKVPLMGDYSRPSVFAGFYGLNAGYYKNKFLVGIKFQGCQGLDAESAGLWYNHQYLYSGLLIGYSLL